MNKGERSLNILGSIITVTLLFIPNLREILLRPIHLNILAIIIFLYLVYLFNREIKNLKRIKLVFPQTSNQTTPPDLKTEIVPFPEHNVEYALEFPLGKDDLANWLHGSGPRCLNCHTRMESPKHSFMPSFNLEEKKYTCAGCGNQLGEDLHKKLNVLAKKKIIEMYKNKS